jgi:hypothetical protein
MTRRILLDSDYLISAFDKSKTDVDKRRSEVVEKLLSDPNTRFLITPLLFYEALRKCENPEVMEEKLNRLGFKYIDVGEVHGRRAAEAFRFAIKQNQGRRPEWLDKRSFDLFHCVFEGVDKVELVSDDEHIPKLREHLKQLDDSRQP